MSAAQDFDLAFETLDDQKKIRGAFTWALARAMRDADPGEPASERSDPAAPRAVSNWPDFRSDGRPRAATVVVQRSDGGLIGT